MSKDFIQNSKQWLDWRYEGLGASDAPIYYENKAGNFSKYKTKKQLFEEKVHKKSKPVKNTFIQDLGHETEEVARSIMELNFSFKEWKDISLAGVCAISETHKHLRASLDGFSEDLDLIWECKLCGKDKFKMITDGQCPDDFYIQTQHQMMVTSKKKVLLTAVWLQFDNNRRPIIDYKKMSSIYIERNDTFIKELQECANNFWNEILEKRKELDAAK